MLGKLWTLWPLYCEETKRGCEACGCLGRNGRDEPITAHARGKGRILFGRYRQFSGSKCRLLFDHLFSFDFLFGVPLSFSLKVLVSSSPPPLECRRAGLTPCCPCESPASAIDWLHSACRSLPRNLGLTVDKLHVPPPCLSFSLSCLSFLCALSSVTHLVILQQRARPAPPMKAVPERLAVYASTVQSVQSRAGVSQFSL